MLEPYLLLALGLLLLLSGGYALVVAASSLARSLGVSRMAIGLTIVAFGTSAPELAVNLAAALRGTSDLAFGNIIGSNLANLGLILGATTLIRPLRIRSRVVYLEIPRLILVSGFAVLLAPPSPASNAAGGFGRLDGGILLALFAALLWLSMRDMRRGDDDPVAEGIEDEHRVEERRTAARSWLLALAGMTGLGIGGYLTAASATELATLLEVPPVLMGLSVVALGTSLPELVTCAIAAAKGETDLAVGNIVGSNIFNLLFILGATAVASPVPVPPGGYADLVVLMGVTALLLPFAITHRGWLVRAEGAVLLLVWMAYTIWRLAAG